MDIKLNDILPYFPNFKLSYGKNPHNKVYKYDYAIAIPFGTKCYVWFTVYKSQNICILLTLNSFTNQIVDLEQITGLVFSPELSYDTILYGTLYKKSNIKYFIIEDLYYYLGQDMVLYSFTERLSFLDDLFDTRLDTTIMTSDILLRIAHVYLKHDKIHLMNTNIYPCQHIIYRFIANNNLILTVNCTAVFTVKAMSSTDIYRLYYMDINSSLKEFAIANISSYESSVMMNSLYRKIKENNNLDALEESDDEYDFENVQENKYVDLNVSHNMDCRYNISTNSWTPISITNSIPSNKTYIDNIIENFCQYSCQKKTTPYLNANKYPKNKYPKNKYPNKPLKN